MRCLLNGVQVQRDGDVVRRLTVLVVDDEQHVRSALRAALLGAGHEVVDDAADAKTAFALGVLHEPDVVVLDHHLGSSFGGDLVRSLIEAVPGCRVVVFTANDSESLRRRAVDDGAAVVVDKAAGVDGLLAALAALT